MFEGIEFLNKEFFWLFLFAPLAIGWYIWKRKNQTATLKMSSTEAFKDTSLLSKLRPLLLLLRMAALSFVILALARPQRENVSTKTKINKGIDIVMAIDISSSMLARDLRPNRLRALKKVAGEFIKGRPNDRHNARR